MKKNSIFLFQGDSITDCGRSREFLDSLGNGYVEIIHKILQSKYSPIGTTIINRGVSGDRIIDLIERWEDDCIFLNPDILTILVGINDCWRKYDQNDPSSTRDFENNYRNLIKRTQDKLPNIKIVIMEPFVLPYPSDRAKWREDLDPKIQAIRSIAVDLKCYFIPLDGIFAQASTIKEYAYWLEDGVHPTYEGHKIIAAEWIKLYENQILPESR